jgi:hypothetical protein
MLRIINGIIILSETRFRARGLSEISFNEHKSAGIWHFKPIFTFLAYETWTF